MAWNGVDNTRISISTSNDGGLSFLQVYETTYTTSSITWMNGKSLHCTDGC